MNSFFIRILALAFLGIMMTPVAFADDASAALYKSKCAMCHAADGSGSAMGKKTGAHDFRSAEIQKMTDAQLIELAAKGKNKMPAYDKKLTADQIKGLVAHIRELMKKK